MCHRIYDKGVNNLGLEKKFHFHYGWLVLAMGTLAVLGALGLARFGYAMLLPNMQADLGMDNSQAGLLATLSLLGYLALAIIGGALAARYGVRIIASVGLLFIGVGMLFTGLSNSFVPVVFWSALAGLGSGAVNIAIMGLWPAWFSQKRRGLASGIAISGCSIGLVTTGLVVPIIISAYGASAWQISWIIFGVITMILALGSYIIIRNNPQELGMMPIGINEGNLPVPVKREKIPYKDIYLSPPAWSLGLVYFAFGFSYIVFMTFFVKHLVSDVGFTQAAAGKLYMFLGWVSMPSGLIWGAVSDSIGRKTTLTILYLVHTVALILFALGSSPVFFIFSAILYGLTLWSIPAIMSATCGDLFGSGLAPATLGFITLFFGIGQVLGPATAGFLADKTGSFSSAFLISAAISFLGAVSSMLLIKTAARKVNEKPIIETL